MSGQESVVSLLPATSLGDVSHLSLHQKILSRHGVAIELTYLVRRGFEIGSSRYQQLVAMSIAVVVVFEFGEGVLLSCGISRINNEVAMSDDGGVVVGKRGRWVRKLEDICCS
jgi:hypothetical protein